jgi:hypothetical protein
MAKVETRQQLLLTSEEVETLRKARIIFLEINTQDSGGEIFCQADNYDTEWDWLINFIENLIFNSEEK